MTFSEKLLALRRRAGFSQENLAEKLEVSRQAVSRWEGGSALPDALNLLKLSELFSVSTDCLLKDEMTLEELPAGREGRGDHRGRLISALGRCLVLIGAFGFGGLTVGSVCFPADVIRDSRHYSGLWGFLKFYDLEWAFFLTVGLLAAGMLAALWPLVHRK